MYYLNPDNKEQLNYDILQCIEVTNIKHTHIHKHTLWIDSTKMYLTVGQHSNTISPLTSHQPMWPIW